MSKKICHMVQIQVKNTFLEVGQGAEAKGGRLRRTVSDPCIAGLGWPDLQDFDLAEAGCPPGASLGDLRVDAGSSDDGPSSRCFEAAELEMEGFKSVRWADLDDADANSTGCPSSEPSEPSAEHQPDRMIAKGAVLRLDESVPGRPKARAQEDQPTATVLTLDSMLPVGPVAVKVAGRAEAAGFMPSVSFGLQAPSPAAPRTRLKSAAAPFVPVAWGLQASLVTAPALSAAGRGGECEGLSEKAPLGITTTVEQVSPRSMEDEASLSTAQPDVPCDTESEEQVLPADDGEDEVRSGTTVMLCRLPPCYTKEMLLGLIDSKGFRGHYDYVYLPVKITSMKNVGYAFVNLTSEEEADRFHETFSGFDEWACPFSGRAVVTWGRLQGFWENVERYRNSPILNDDVPDCCKPAAFKDGYQVAFPGRTEPVRPMRCRERGGTH